MQLDTQFNGKMTTVTIGDLRTTFSYSTVVAMSDMQESIVHENVWGPTTGKHLNAVDGGTKDAKALRLDGEEFDKRQRAMLKRHKL